MKIAICGLLDWKTKKVLKWRLQPVMERRSKNRALKFEIAIRGGADERGVDGGLLVEFEPAAD